MLDEACISAAADTIRNLWRTGEKLAELAPSMRPATRREGYAIQSRLDAGSQTPFGWKIAATSAAGQAHIGVDGPIAGRLLAGHVNASGATLSLRGNLLRVAEPEFAFRMGSDLLPRAKPYAAEEVLAAVASLHPAIEVPDSRFERFARIGAPALIADNACAHDFVLGQAAPDDWRAIELAKQPTRIEITGKSAATGSGANVLGDPAVALTWLANELSSLGIPLRAGAVVSTGTSTLPIAVAPGDYVVADLGPIGRVEAGFTS